MNGNLEESQGFAIMLLKPEPDFPEDFGSTLNGIRDDFNGAGVFLYKSHTRQPGKWVNNQTSCCLYSSSISSISLLSQSITGG